MTSAGTVGVVLAAGAGTRLGRGPKALLPHHGRPLVEHVAGVLAAGGCDVVVVVLGAEAARVRAAADLTPHAVVVADGWADGLGASLRAGVAEADARGADRVVVALGDQPGVTADDVARLLAAHAPGRVAASRWTGGTGGARPGHPLVLDLAHARAALPGAGADRGFRDWLAAHADLVDAVDQPGDGRDVDSADDLGLLAP